jgi:K+-transporting ATPase c subunit
MIQERFLQSAVNIRRTYLKVSSSLDKYHKKAKDTLEVLNNTLKKIEKLQETVEKANSGKDTKITEQEALSQLLKIIQDVEDEGKTIEKLTDPINQQIE